MLALNTRRSGGVFEQGFVVGDLRGKVITASGQPPRACGTGLWDGGR